jgi:hypothetical protein
MFTAPPKMRDAASIQARIGFHESLDIDAPFLDRGRNNFASRAKFLDSATDVLTRPQKSPFDKP